MNGGGHARAGFTLVELMLSLVVMGILMGIMSGALVVTGRAIEGARTERVRSAAEVVQSMQSELKTAISFDDDARTPTSIGFLVPDLNGDELAETIEYEWVGAAGSPGPLVRRQNGGAPYVVAADVHHFALDYVVTTVEGTGGTDESGEEPGLRILMLVDRETLHAEEALRQYRLESWGYEVTTLEAEVLLDAYQSAYASHDVVYVPDRVNENDVDDKLLNAPIGVVVEHKEIGEELQLLGDQSSTSNAASFIIANNEHYITRPFFPGLLPVLERVEALLYADRDQAPDLVALGEHVDDPAFEMLHVMEAGGSLVGGGTASGRRVIMPWGQGFAFADVNDTGLQLLRRALEWAGNAERPDLPVRPLFAQFEDVSAGDRSHQVKLTNWAVASIVPDLPPGAVSWKITRASIRASQDGEANRWLVVQIMHRNAMTGEPMSDTPLAQISVHESELPVEPDWVEFEFDMIPSIPATVGACIAFGSNFGDNAGRVYYQSGLGEATPMNQFWKGKTGDWDSSENDDIPIVVHGTVEVE